MNKIGTQKYKFSVSYSFFGHDDASQQLVLQALHGHSEVNDRCTSADLNEMVTL